MAYGLTATNDSNIDLLISDKILPTHLGSTSIYLNPDLTKSTFNLQNSEGKILWYFSPHYVSILEPVNSTGIVFSGLTYNTNMPVKNNSGNINLVNGPMKIVEGIGIHHQFSLLDHYWGTDGPRADSDYGINSYDSRGLIQASSFRSMVIPVENISILNTNNNSVIFRKKYSHRVGIVINKNSRYIVRNSNGTYNEYVYGVRLDSSGYLEVFKTLSRTYTATQGSELTGPFSLEFHGVIMNTEYYSLIWDNRKERKITMAELKSLI